MNKLLFVILLSMFGCSQSERQSGATGAGNPSPYAMTLQIEGRTPISLNKTGIEGNPTIQDSLGTAFTIESAKIHIGRVRIEAEVDGCSGGDCEDGWFTAETGWTVDLLSGTSIPFFPVLQILPGVYRKLEIRVEKEDSVQYLPEGVGFDLWLNTIKDGTPIRLHVPLSFDAEMKFENLRGVSLDTGESMVLWFNLSEWLQGVNVDACLADESLKEVSADTWEITDGSCGDIKSIVKENIQNSGNIE